MNSSYDLFIFAGEASGDLYGEELIKALREKQPDLKMRGVGGPLMREVGFDCLMQTESFEVMGLFDVLPALPRLYRYFTHIRNEILKSKPRAVLFIDYPGFNLRMARSLKRKKTTSQLLHFVCPSVWAWGKGRIPLMENTLDTLMTLFSFEAELFSPSRLHVEYVGHPLVARMRSHEYEATWRFEYGIPERSHILSLFPGSRRREIERNLPLQLKVAREFIRGNPKTLLAISCARQELLPLLKQFDLGDAHIIHSNHLYELMHASHLAIATSGTVTLELALHQVPTVVTFVIKQWDAWIARRILRINLPHYSLPNIILKEQVFPEFFGTYLTQRSLTQALQKLDSSRLYREQCICKCKDIKTRIGRRDAPREAAAIILKSIFGKIVPTHRVPIQ